MCIILCLLAPNVGCHFIAVPLSIVRFFHIFKSRFLFFLSWITRFKKHSAHYYLTHFPGHIWICQTPQILAQIPVGFHLLSPTEISVYSYFSHQFQRGCFPSSCYSFTSLVSSDWGAYQKLSENLSTPYQPNHPNPHACRCFRWTAADFFQTQYLLTRDALTPFRSLLLKIGVKLPFSFSAVL